MRAGIVGWAVAAAVVSVALAGCRDLVRKVLPRKTFHENFNWKAEDYFRDPEVIALCHAIEANDIDEIDRLVAAGVDVNTQGKDKMTPLLWAFPDNKLARFKRLLEHGADPNVIFDSDFGARSAIRPGNSVTHMAAGITFPGYFEAVFSHGGDPNLVKTAAVGKGDTPLFTLIKAGSPNKKRRIRFLIDKGADTNHVDASGFSAPMLAVGWFGQYDIALMLLEAGADHMIYMPRSNQRLVHMVLAKKNNPITTSAWTPQQRADFQALVRWLEDHGESFEQARRDDERWDSWSKLNGEYRRKMDAEVAARKAREAQEKKRAIDIEQSDE